QGPGPGTQQVRHVGGFSRDPVPPRFRAAGPPRRSADDTTTMTDQLAPNYDPGSFESRLYAEWEASGVFAPRGDGPAYTILLPPPNVTGTLHMGHAFQHTL